MPAQTTAGNTVYYSEGDTYPPLTAQLTDGNDDPIDLTGCTVTINIAHARWSYFYSPSTLIVTNGVCEVNIDQSNYTGYVSWTPEEGDLTPPGSYAYTFRVQYPSGGVQTIPGNTYSPLVIKTPLPHTGGA
jgi:hypothetical protein